MEIQRLDFGQEKHSLDLCRLVEETIVSGAFSYAYERVGGYEPFAHTQGNQFSVFVAIDSNQILAATQLTLDQVYWNGKSAAIAYSGDTRVSPKARGQKLADRLISKACVQALPVLGAVLGSNHLVLNRKLADWKKVGVDFKIVGELKVLMCLARKKKCVKEVRAATSHDLMPMFELWKREQSQRNLGRYYADLESFAQSYSAPYGVSLSNTFVYQDQTTQAILGFLSVWDQSAVRKIRVRRLNLGMKILRTLMSPWIQIPNEKEELKISYGHQTCFDSNRSEVVGTLIDVAQTQSTENGSLFFSIGFDVRDSAYSAAKNKALITNSVKVISTVEPSDDRFFQLEVGLG